MGRAKTKKSVVKPSSQAAKEPVKRRIAGKSAALKPGPKIKVGRPWEAAGLSKAQYYRNLRNGKGEATE
jgi:hypothetical protein